MNKSHLVDGTIEARYTSGETPAAIARSLGITLAAVNRRLQATSTAPRQSTKAMQHMSERAIIALLYEGGSFTAKEIQNACGNYGYIWEALMRLKRIGFVYRAAVHGDWRTFDSWKLTGCGRIAALTTH